MNAENVNQSDVDANLGTVNQEPPDVFRVNNEAVLISAKEADQFEVSTCGEGKDDEEATVAGRQQTDMPPRTDTMREWVGSGVDAAGSGAECPSSSATQAAGNKASISLADPIFGEYTRDAAYCKSVQPAVLSFAGTHVRTGAAVLIRIEAFNTAKRSWLTAERDVLAQLPASDVVPLVIKADIEVINDTPYFVLIMEGLGCSLYHLKDDYKRFSEKTNLMVAHQLVARLIELHAAGFLHRNIALHTFAFGGGEKCFILMNYDYTMCVTAASSENRIHVTDTGFGVMGPVTYASRGVMTATKDTRYNTKDDWESLCYMLMHMCVGTLPWLSIKYEPTNPAKCLEDTLRAKQAFDVDNWSPLLSNAHKQFYRAVDAMQPNTNAAELGGEFSEIFLRYMEEQNIPYDHMYDWCEQMKQ